MGFKRRLLAAATSGALAAGPTSIAAEGLSWAGGRLRLAGEWTGTWAARERGYFNYTDYASSTLRQSRLSVDVEGRLAGRLSLLARARMVDLEAPRLSAAYLRWRAAAALALDVQAGRVPPVFGSFGRRGYGNDMPLAGLPLAYQYLTTLRADAAPSSAAQLLAWRGEGWLPRYALPPAPGLPLVQLDPWDTGVQLRAGRPEALEAAAALTQGSLGAPRVRDDNSGKQLSARVARSLGSRLLLGVSAARGQYLARAAGRGRQQAFGLDAEYAHGRVLVRGELIRSAWDLPGLERTPLACWSAFVEGRARLAAGWDLGARLDRLAFGHLAPGPAGTWDADVWRTELGLAWRPLRELRLTAAYQHNWRTGGTSRQQGFVIGQAAWRF